ncbi:ABC transporter ATP-binding protein/permease [Enterococcus xiangfangensis]|uniref:ATP-binding cassette domain-containing protein n=1 Tax=Enterococcus xiangfangensis TaxID=1296537 RepID=A0ABU3F677_9ENTE|nr:ATP-binding cassette domain-containing protein [Enterococcus xiangfangensis]MDT2758172.1 ATP-binding cassette domain-containing protein [Enterococcus xiangfangensis]
MSFLKLSNIHKSYFLGKEEFPVLKGIDLDFELGEFVSILGESGGGKSTLMNIIGGLDREFEGEVLVDGKPLDHKDEKSLDAYRRDTIGYIYQAYNLISHLSVLDNVLISLDMTTLNKEEREKRALNLLKRVGLQDQAKKYPNQLSGGQKQRVAIARALASDPKVIIADEPTGALDSQNTTEVLQILNEIAAEGRLVIAVTHSQAVADTGTRIVHLSDGKIDDNKRIRDAYQPQATPSPIKSRLLPASVSIKTAIKHLKFNFWRNSLIVIGTAIGLFAVILFSGLGNGISGYINQQVTDMANPQVITVARYQKKTTAAPTPGGDDNPMAAALTSSSITKKPTFSTDQINQINELKHVNSVQESYTASNVMVKNGEKSATISSLSNWTKASTESSIDVGHKPGKGEIILDKEAVAKKITDDNYKDLVGKTVDLSYTALDDSGKKVTVAFSAKVAGIGSNSAGMQGINIINTTTLTDAMAAANIDTTPTSLAVKIDHLDNVKAVNKKINKIKADDKRLYSSSSIASMIDTIQTYVSLASTVLAVIAGISLIVSALMIIVTMYMSVSARTKEIGILRALGESKRDIRRLFISESLVIGIVSAVLGTGLAFGIGAIANAVLQPIAAYSFVQISFTNVLSTFIIALVISLIAALLPSRHAASLNPIDALSAD